jgi:NMD protein affecting ribosome stability and mRNA decay
MSTNRYNRLKAAGLCARCGKVPPEEGRVLCAECTQKNRDKARITCFQRLRECNWLRQRYLARREKGICVRCGKAPAEDGRALCQECLAYMREYERNRNARLREQHICVRCGAETDGTSYCDACREWLREYNREAQRRRRSERNV